MNTTSSPVLITGANGGIGQSLVRTFVQHGYEVIATDQHPVPESLGASHFIQADIQKTVQDADYGEQVLTRIRKCLPNGQLHALINNAAVQILASTAELTRQNWTDTLQCNLLAPFFWTQSLLPELEAVGGSVVNISSIHARQTKAGFVAYATSKAALSALTRNMAIDLGDRIRVNAIEPAAVRTSMLLEGFADEPSGLDKLSSFHPVGRIAEPDEIANVALFLCSDDASFLHGSIISTTGGIDSCLHDPA